MFTGIVSAVGHITEVTGQDANDPAAGVRLSISAPGFLREATRIGDSISIQGACMTVTSMPDSQSNGVPGNMFTVDVSRESLDRTAGLDRKGPVNLEHAMRMGDTLDGHLVSGHVDGLGAVQHFAPVGESWDLRIQVPASLARYMAYKGSITVDGVSLTINRVEDNEDGCVVHINLIPHTIQVTTLGQLAEGRPVNLEVDMIARYVERMMSA